MKLSTTGATRSPASHPAAGVDLRLLAQRSHHTPDTAFFTGRPACFRVCDSTVPGAF